MGGHLRRRVLTWSPPPAGVLGRSVELVRRCVLCRWVFDGFTSAGGCALCRRALMGGHLRRRVLTGSPPLAGVDGVHLRRWVLTGSPPPAGVVPAGVDVHVRRRGVDGVQLRRPALMFTSAGGC